ncbi:hypothetical protein BDV41DRAFT_265945 [Aspergillus transmontanensis]|uniref:Uncharacterized protein n=1 Tax=Aspergillus transmontanensis TaxID=1034304 RepID=A0A5N6VY62_9EURO|nr:hypothetical protein BDV41DRAFT_265945 [Aspergillus transmontanensis]
MKKKKGQPCKGIEVRTRHSNVVTDWPTAPLGIVRAVQTCKPQAVEDFPGFAKANGGSRIMVEGEEAKDGSTRHAVTAAPPPLVCSSSDLLLLSSFPLHHHTLNPFRFLYSAPFLRTRNAFVAI